MDAVEDEVVVGVVVVITVVVVVGVVVMAEVVLKGYFSCGSNFFSSLSECIRPTLPDAKSIQTSSDVFSNMPLTQCGLGVVITENAGVCALAIGCSRNSSRAFAMVSIFICSFTDALCREICLNGSCVGGDSVDGVEAIDHVGNSKPNCGNGGSVDLDVLIFDVVGRIASAGWLLVSTVVHVGAGVGSFCSIMTDPVNSTWGASVTSLKLLPNESVRISSSG